MSSGWNDYPLESITIPGTASDTDPRVYVGSDDPTAESLAIPASLVFYGGDVTHQDFLFGVRDYGPDAGKLTMINRWSADMVPLDFFTMFRASAYAQVTIGPEDTDIGSMRIYITGNFVSINDDNSDYDVRITGVSVGRGIVASGEAAAATAFGANVTLVTSSAVDFKIGRAYEIDVQGTCRTSVASGGVLLRARETNFGTQCAEWGTYPLPATGNAYPVQGKRIIICGATQTNSIQIFGIASTGTIQGFGSASAPFDVTVRDVGPASWYPNAPVM